MVLLAAIIFYSLSTLFRLLDNSAEVFIAHKISVTPFYLTSEEIKGRLAGITDKKVRFKLKRNLFYKMATRVCIGMSILLFIAAVIYEIYDPKLYNLLVGNL